MEDLHLYEVEDFCSISLVIASSDGEVIDIVSEALEISPEKYLEDFKPTIVQLMDKGVRNGKTCSDWISIYGVPDWIDCQFK